MNHISNGYELMQTQTHKYIARFTSDANTVSLREWLDASGKKLRSKRLGDIIFAHCNSNSLSHYKYGRVRISAELHARIEKAKIEVEKQESLIEASQLKNKQTIAKPASRMTANKFKQYFEVNQTFDLFKKFANTELTIDQVITDKSLVAMLPEFIKISDNLLIEGNDNNRIEVMSNWLDDANRQVKLRLANAIYAHNYMKIANYNTQYMSTTILDSIKSKIVPTTYDRIELIMNKVDNMINERHQFAIAAGLTS